MSYWRILFDQCLNSLLASLIVALPQLVFRDGFDWRPVAVSGGIVFAAKLAGYRRPEA